MDERTATVHIDVMLKPEILDPQGQAVQRALPTLGFAGVRDGRIGKHVELVVDDPADDPDAVAEQAARMAEQLLANPVIETFTVRVERQG